MKPKILEAKVLRVIDGDTLVIKSDRKKHQIDLSYIDTAQLASGERSYGRIARDWLTGLVQKGDRVDIRFEDSFWAGGSRRQAEVRLAGGDNIAGLMVKKGYAFLDDWPDKGHNQLSALERRAKNAGKGFWGSWVDMGYSKSERRIRRINRGLADDAPSGGGVPPPPDGGGGTPPPDGGGGTKLPLFDPGPGLPGLSDITMRSINGYNGVIADYNRTGDCFYIGLAREYANLALLEDYTPLARAFNSANALTDCGEPSLII